MRIWVYTCVHVCIVHALVSNASQTLFLVSPRMCEQAPLLGLASVLLGPMLMRSPRPLQQIETTHRGRESTQQHSTIEIAEVLFAVDCLPCQQLRPSHVMFLMNCRAARSLPAKF